MTDKSINHWETYETGNGFLSYLKDSSHARDFCRVQIKHLIDTRQIHSLIEVGVGGLNEIRSLASVYKSRPEFKFTGTDWTPRFITEAKNEFPEFTWQQLDIVTCNVEESMKHDAVYSQHVLEHCPGLNPPLTNMLKMTRKVLFNIFFMPPSVNETINFSQYPLYHNTYSINHIRAVCDYHGFDASLIPYNNADKKDAGECQDEMVLVAVRRA